MAIPPNNINNAYATDSFLPPNPAMSKLESAPEDVVRAILLALCQDPAQERKAMQYYAKLNALKSKTLAPVVNNAGASAGSKTNPVVISDGGDEKSRYESYSKGKEGNKRKAASEVRICTRCKEAFSEDENHLEACLYHPGDLDARDDASVFEEWEDWRDGDMYSKESMEDHPEAYEWDCCKKDSQSSGCTRGSHTSSLKKPPPFSHGIFI
ncbi:hypothetical protein F4825DRAFT_428051 [Nemania diffusa]|nr:hypothetical protein F4825DRAFT_428051 [Nemania diffusa]